MESGNRSLNPSQHLTQYPDAPEVQRAKSDGSWVQINYRQLRLGSQKVFIISDQHLNHENIHEYCGRSEDWYRAVRSAWKKYVRPEDLVIDLGDVIFHNPGQLDDFIKPLPGKKLMVRGNHDKNPAHWYMSRGYDAVVDQFVMGPVVFNHRPMSVLPPGCTLCVHGHLHNNQWREDYLSMVHYNQLYAIEYEDESPMLLKTFLEVHGRLVDDGQRDSKKPRKGELLPVWEIDDKTDRV